MATDTTGWAEWSNQLAHYWTDEIQAAWDDAAAYARSAVEAMTPDAALDLAQEFYSLLWGGGGFSLFDLRDELSTREAEAAAAGVDVEATRARVIAQLAVAGDVDANDTALTAAYADGRCRWYGMGFMKDAAPAEGKVGWIPILVGGLVIGIVALCWCRVRMDEARNDQRRWHWMGTALAADTDAKKKGLPPPDFKALSAAGQSATAPQSDGWASWYGGGGSSLAVPIIGGAAALVLLVALAKR